MAHDGITHDNRREKIMGLLRRLLGGSSRRSSGHSRGTLSRIMGAIRGFMGGGGRSRSRTRTR
jgi:hypothetical protein